MADWFHDKVDLDRVYRGWGEQDSLRANQVAQKYLSALHGANLLVQKEAASYRIVTMADNLNNRHSPAHKHQTESGVSRDWKQIKKSFLAQEVSEILKMNPHMREGHVLRRLLIQKYSADPDFFLNFGPA